jgi:Ca2+:H+ antiporter
MQRWDVWAPLAAVALLVAALGLPRSTLLALLCALALVCAVLAAVHHAEVVAHRLGERSGPWSWRSPSR